VAGRKESALAQYLAAGGLVCVILSSLRLLMKAMSIFCFSFFFFFFFFFFFLYDSRGTVQKLGDVLMEAYRSLGQLGG